MLAVTQKVGNEVLITVPPSAEGATIRIKLLAVDRGRARLGFDAPRWVIIHRQEVLDRMAAAQQRPIEGE